MAKLKILILFVLCVGFFAAGSSCGHGSQVPREAHRSKKSKKPEFEQLNSRVWIARSFRHLEKWGFFPANGLIIKTNKGALLVDPGYCDDDAAVIIDWATENVGSIGAVIVTHFHDDRSGGLVEVSRRGIPSFGFHKTRDLARDSGSPQPLKTVSSPFDLSIFGVEAELFFPGPAHTRDNVTIWLEEERLLFGGCLLKSSASKSLGNIADASLDEWPAAIRRLSARYPDIRVAVPGHGRAAGGELLANTLRLLSLAQEKP